MTLTDRIAELPSLGWRARKQSGVVTVTFDSGIYECVWADGPFLGQDQSAWVSVDRVYVHAVREYTWYEFATACNTGIDPHVKQVKQVKQVDSKSRSLFGDD